MSGIATRTCVECRGWVDSPYAYIRPLDAGALAPRSRRHLSQSRHRRRAAAARARQATGAARRDGAPAVAVRAARAERRAADAVARRVAAPRGDRPRRAVSGRAPGRSGLRAQRHDRSQCRAALGAARSRRRGGDRRSRPTAPSRWPRGLVTRERGATLRIVEMPYPLRESACDVVDAFVSALTPRTKLVVADHITAQTALVLPVAAIAAACHARGVPVLVDGAHAPGSIARRHSRHRRRLVLRRTCTSGRTRPGRAASSGRSPSIRPRSIIRSSPGAPAMGFMPSSSTRPPAIRRAISPRLKASRSCASGVSTRSSPICTASRARRRGILTDRWGTTLDVPDDMIGAMVTVPLPEAAGATDRGSRRACGSRCSSRIASRCSFTRGAAGCGCASRRRSTTIGRT